MKVIVVDNFVGNPDAVRLSALSSGFGSWQPCNTIMGYSSYDGVNINGMHSPLVRALTNAMGCSIFPASMIFRVTGEKTDPATIHSDRMFADFSCIVYLSIELEKSGTAFYEHRKTKSCEMPPLEYMASQSWFQDHKREMREASEEVWKQVYFVESKYNRAVIFRAPLYHSRIPRVCKGTTPENSRMIWVTHFNTGSIANV